MRKINVPWIIAILSLLSLLSGCMTQSAPPKIDPMNLNQLENARDALPINGQTGSPEFSQIRSKALQDTAMSLGAQGGLAWASRQINCQLEQDKWYLETIYNFNGMMLSHGIIPPVLEEGDNSLNLSEPCTIRVADKTYKIVKQACFATTPPHWREYLWLNYSTPEMPHRVLLPKTTTESRVWRCAVKEGWEMGVKQAYSIFHQNLARLKRDYKGMILYRKLLEEHMVTPPFVSRTELGVTGDGTDMRINDQVLRITEFPQLQTDSSGWKAIVVPNDSN